MDIKTNMPPNLSIILPSIRPIDKLYNSIEASYSGSWELIVVGPRAPLLKKGDPRVRYIEDYGSPNRCQQIGLYNACGDFVTWAADDGEFLPGMLDKMFEYHKAKSSHGDGPIVIGKYLESANPSKCMWEDDYYKFGYHAGLRSPGIDPNFWLMNVALCYRGIIEHYGGWRANIFETTTIAHMDLAIRIQQNAAESLFIYPDPVFQCDHTPGTEGDHGPVHYAHVDHDEPLLKSMYSAHSIEVPCVKIDNWKQSPPVWDRRFGNG